ncbi:MAG: flagellar hook-length control protein FliK [Nitrospira sp.]|nr:flagellar hook-length control protein FliK [Nitrospira sp.]
MLPDQLNVSIKEKTANTQGEAVLSFGSEEASEVLDAGLPSGLKSDMAMVGLSTAASPGSPAQPLPVANGTEDRRPGEIGMEGPVAQPNDSDVESVSRFNHQANRSTTSEASSNDMVRTKPGESPSLTEKSEDGSFPELLRSPAVVTKGDGSSTQGYDKDAGRLLDRTTPSPSHLSEIRDHDEEFVLTGEMHRAEQPTESGDRTSDLDRFTHDADRLQAEMESIRESNAPSDGDQELIAHRLGMTVSGESATQSNSGNPGDLQRQADPTPKRSSIHGSDGDGPGSVLSRSVAFEVSRPDLGHVNVRVAVRNDLVHAHLFSDRPDVAQYLAAGHDRLQSALQANGLEMGQFRVDVDRHGAGRSFHHGPSYDQDRTWRERPAQDRQSMMPESRPYTGTPYAGMLNVVA